MREREVAQASMISARKCYLGENLPCSLWANERRGVHENSLLHFFEGVDSSCKFTTSAPALHVSTIQLHYCTVVNNSSAGYIKYIEGNLSQTSKPSSS